MKAPPPIRLAAFDMDGTLVRVSSSWAVVHAHFQDNNREGLRAFLNDEIDDAEFVRRDLEIWHRHKPDLRLEDLERILAGVPLMDGAPELFAALHARGIRTAIVSGGLDILAQRLKRELKVHTVAANGFVTDHEGRLLRGNQRVLVKEKERALREIQAQLGFDPEETASVGNSEIDVGLFRASRIGIAFAPEDEKVRRHATHVVEGSDMRELLPLIVGGASAHPRRSH